MQVPLTLINNTAFALSVDVCGVQVPLAPASKVTQTVTLPGGGSMPVSGTLGGRRFSTNVDAGSQLAQKREFDYAPDNVLNLYQHLETGSGDVLAAMTLHFGPAFSSTNWMGQLDLSADPSLAEITLPGTHDTATWAASKASKCQTLDLAGQLQAGIRWFDLRLAVSGDDLRIWHGSERQDVYLARDLLPVIKTFLDTHPTETVVLCATNVSWSYDYAEFDGQLHKLLMAGVTPNKLYDRPACPKVSALAGCVVLMRTDKEATFGLMALNWPDDRKGTVWNDSGSFLYSVQNAYRFGSDYLSAKWALIHAQLECARLRQDGAGWYVNFTSASRAPITDPDEIALNENQHGMNYLLHGYLCEQVGPQYFGTLPMDFPESPTGLIKLVISMNKLKPG